MIINQIVSLIEESLACSDTELRAKINLLMKGEILQQEIKALSEYRSAKLARIASTYGIKFKQYSLYMLFHDEVSELVGEAWRQSLDKDSTQHRINATSKLYNKSRQVMFDLLAIFEAGALTNSLTLWRSMYENFVFAKYLLSVSDEESDRFNDYAEIQMHQLSKEYAIRNQDKIMSLLRRHGESFSQPYGWMNICKRRSIDGLIRQIKETEFVDYYRFSSMQLHASSLSVNRSIFHDRNHGNADMLGVFTEGIGFPFNLSIKLMFRFAEMMISFFANGELKDLLLVANRIISTEVAIREDDQQ